MSIIPTSIIYLCKGIPLDSSYKNTITFNSREEQATYFLGKASKSTSNYTVIKENEIRIEGSIGEYYNFNYLLYKNSNFSDKWFFAFIDSVDYINPNTTLLRFSIDVMQTWLFDWTFLDCMIDREHVDDDTPFTHLEPENIDIGEYIYYDDLHLFTTEIGDKIVCMGLTEPLPEEVIGTPEWQQGVSEGFVKYYPPSFYCGYYKAVYTYTFKGGLTTYKVLIPSALDYLARSAKLNSLVELYEWFDGFFEESVFLMEKGVDVLTRPGYLYPNNTQYIPRNKKLLQYPFQFIELNGWGQIQELKYELFDTTTNSNKFYVGGYPSPGGVITVWPNNYMSRGLNLDASVSSPPLPLLQYSSDIALNEYMANINTRNASIQNQILSGAYGFGSDVIKGAMSGGKAGAITSGVENIIGNLFNIKQAINSYEATQTDTLRRPVALGNQNSNPSLPYTLRMYTPFYQVKGIRKEYCEKIDKYFDMYGYCVNYTGRPNIKSRPKYNFLKCHIANIKSNLNTKDTVGITQILENGITFWHDPNIVGDYSVNNTI